MTDQNQKYSESPRELEGALFLLAKKAWLEEQVTRWGAPKTPPTPLQGQLWAADPRRLPIQHRGESPADHTGASVKLDLRERDLSHAFSPRPFLIVSNNLVLDQGFAWVCLCSGTPERARSGATPDWIVELEDERNSYCHTHKIQTITTGFLDDVERRELLRFRRTLSTREMSRVRDALLRNLTGEFRPKHDPLPPGSVVNASSGQRLVISSCDISGVYQNGRALTATVPLERGSIPLVDGHLLHPTIVPLARPHTDERQVDNRGTGFLDLVDLRSRHRPATVSVVAEPEEETLQAARDAVAAILRPDLTQEPP